jgi:perosamine synthetase
VTDVPIPLARPVLGAAEERAVIEVLRSGQLSLGPRLAEFEQLFAARVGAGHAAAVSSGTAGLHLALRAAGVQAGDEVVTTPFSFVASANAVLYQEATPVFADIDPTTFNLDPVAAESAVTERTKAILPVHIFGCPADMPAFERIGEEHGLTIVEDACEALGARHADGLPVGGRGNLAVFGFYANKQITTGEGGMVVMSSGLAKERIDSERNQGRAPDMSWLDHDRLGFNYRLSEIACALGIEQLRRLDSLLEARQRVAELYGQALADIDGLVLPAAELDGCQRSWFVYVVLLPDSTDRDALIQDLAEVGIQTKPYLPAIHLFGFYRNRFGYRPGQFPQCEKVSAKALALPFSPRTSEDEIARVTDALRAALGSHG